MATSRLTLLGSYTSDSTAFTNHLPVTRPGSVSSSLERVRCGSCSRSCDAEPLVRRDPLR